MEYWPWWLSGLALSGVMLFHWLTLQRMMAVSGRVSSLIDFFRHGSPEPAPKITAEEMLAAIQAATADEFGPDEVPEPSKKAAAAPASTQTLPLPVRSKIEHALFMGGLVLGGIIATAVNGVVEPTMTLAGDTFLAVSGGNRVVSGGILLLGGMLVGFGTRMSGGCTSGHGLCGTSRVQPGSLVATASFFSAGIITSFALGALL